MSRARAPRRPPRGPLSIPETATPGRGAGPQASRAPLSRGGRPRGPSSSPRPPGAPLSRSPSLNGPTVKSGPALCPCYAPRSMGALTLMGATRDGCFLGETNVCEPRICAARPKDAPTTGQPGRAPQTACRGLPAAAGAARGARRPRVSGAADRPGCAFAPVPAGSTSSPPRPWASISDLMGSQHPPARSYSSVVFICFFPSPPHPPVALRAGRRPRSRPARPPTPVRSQRRGSCRCCGTAAPSKVPGLPGEGARPEAPTWPRDGVPRRPDVTDGDRLPLPPASLEGRTVLTEAASRSVVIKQFFPRPGWGACRQHSGSIWPAAGGGGAFQEPLLVGDGPPPPAPPRSRGAGLTVPGASRELQAAQGGGRLMVHLTLGPLRPPRPQPGPGQGTGFRHGARVHFSHYLSDGFPAEQAVPVL